MLSPGVRFGPFEIVGSLGAGGMGEVYRARDSKLHRDVAIKVLPAAFAADADRLARFEREARTLAALNHANIAHIYGLEEANESKALVMELVEGPTLGDRITQGALPLEEAIPIAKQIALGLEAAHEQGIVHRDLKPANIKVRPDGTVKVLDFGLAKALESADGNSLSLDRSASPTMTSPAMTSVGTILGTAAYMSPEQARGKSVDKRTDIWAFGCVLFEMLAGRATFEVGDTVSDAVAAVLKGEPQWSALPAETPRDIRTLLQRCLQKEPKQRIRDIGDVLWELERPTRIGPAPAAHAGGWFPWVIVAAAVLVAIVGWWRPWSAPPDRSRLFLSIAPPFGVQLVPVGNLGSAPVISPDGLSVLYRAQNWWYVRRLDSLEARQVPGTAGPGNAPFWSADSTAVYFPNPTQLMRVRLPDGAPEVVAPLNAPTRSGGQSDTGTLLITQSGTTMVARSAGGGDLKAVRAPGMKEGGFIYPEFLPGSEDFLFYFRPRGGEEGEIYLATLRDATIVNPVLLMKNDTAAGYSAEDGRLWFVRNDNLYAQRLNRQKRALEGDPELMAAGVASQPGNTVYRADFTVSRNGTVAWRPGKAALAQVTVLDRQGRLVTTAGPAGALNSVLLSPDDARVMAWGGERAMIVEPGQPGQLALPRGPIGWIAWSADGLKLRGRRFEPGRRDQQIVERSVDASGELRVIGEAAESVGRIHDLSPDSLTLLADDDQKMYAARIVGTAEQRAPAVLAETGVLRDARFSPDGRWIVYEADGLYVQPFPGPGRRRQIGRGTDPVWRRDSKEIVYLAQDSVWSIPVTGAGTNLEFGTPTKLFGGIRTAPGTNAASRPLAVSHDGSRFYIPQALEQPGENVIHIMTGRTAGWAQ